jgi:hypothetical protein
MVPLFSHKWFFTTFASKLAQSDSLKEERKERFVDALNKLQPRSWESESNKFLKH